MLKFIIHIKRLATAFFVTVVLNPFIWLIQLVFSGLIVPSYRAYILISRKALDSNQVSATKGKMSNLLMSRLTIHSLIIVLGIILIYTNTATKTKVVSSSELVGKTKLASLIATENTDNEQLIEDYPNLNVAKLDRRFKYGQDSLQARSSILTKEEIRTEGTNNQVAQQRSSAISYTIQNGDTISSIAHRFGVSINTILWENNLKATSLIKPGNQLNILPTSGVSHTVAKGQTLGQIAKLYGIDSQEILKANGIANPNQISIGVKLIIPGASQLVANNNTPRRVITNQISSSLQAIISKDRTTSSVIPAGSRMAWPTTGHRITQYYSWTHTGVDIADHIGTPIYAADSGVVKIASWNSGGYGNMILIDHGNGKTTRYGHLSAFDVRAGQKVTKGQYIGAMGSTGRSTGPHLHFEVMFNGVHYNPLNYVR